MSQSTDFLVPKPYQEYNQFDNRLYRAFISRNPGYRLVPPHYHPEIEIIVTAGASGEMRLDGRLYPVARQGVYAIRPNVVHSFKLVPDGGGLVYVLQINTEECGRLISGFSKGGISDFFSGLGNMPVECQASAPEIGDGIQKLSQIAHLHHPEGGETSFQEAILDIELLYRILRLLTSEKEATLKLRKRDVNLKRVIDVMESLAYQSTSLDEIARQSSFSKFHLCRMFKQATGMTVQTYLNELRINRACRMLSEEGRNVTETCFECGFENLSYFIQLFRKKTGLPPKQWMLLEKKRLNKIRV